jgi:hypothetical protein
MPHHGIVSRINGGHWGSKVGLRTPLGSLDRCASYVAATLLVDKQSYPRINGGHPHGVVIHE